MDTKRLVLYSALAFIVYSLWINWNTDYPKKVVGQKTITQTSDGTILPHVKETKRQDKGAAPSVSVPKERAQLERDDNFVTVKTDVLNIKINLQNGDVIGADLLQYPLSLEQKDKPTALLQDNEVERYVANSSLFVTTSAGIKNLDFDFKAQQAHYQLSSGDKNLNVVLKGQDKNGLEVTKTFSFERGSYLITMTYNLTNRSDVAWKGYMNTQLVRQSPKQEKSSMFQIGTYTGASYSNPGHQRFEKVSFANMTKSNLDVDAKGGWIAMQQHYFLSSWIPSATSDNRFYTRAIDEQYIIGAVSKAFHLRPNQSLSTGAKLYIGPEIAENLNGVAPNLDMTIDYGFLWFISKLLFSLMSMIYSVVGNWGWAIVLVTMLIKLVFYPLSTKSYKSMAGMRKLQPKMEALKERFADDKEKLSRATMELYRKEKINPLGGCLPILVQIPVFIALYWVLIESVQLRQAPFILWIHDLATPDPFHVLPVIMGLTMLIQQKLNPAPPDPTQAKIMMFLPVLFTALFWNFPAGLVLYWIVNNTLSILQQWYIMRKFGDAPKKKSKPKAIAFNQ
jgi:YidC/Oxa1 family membrane protein insertase